MKKYIVILLVIVSQSLRAQCDFDINVTSVKQSEPCARDGAITVELTGSNVNNLLISSAQYGIESVVAGGNNIPQAVNGGVITQIPPGSYRVKVTVVCKTGNKPISKTSTEIITITGSYVPPNPVEVILPVSPSYKCDSSGVIPVKISGGLPPYTLTAVNGEFKKTFHIPDATDYFELTELPAGTYSLSLKDNCGYFPTTIPQTLDAKNEDFDVGTPTPTLKCKADGKIPVYINEGKSPFTISITSTNGYSESRTETSTGTVVIDQLEEGDYTVEVKDACENNEIFNRTINKISGDASHSYTRNSGSCGSASGEIGIALNTAVAPYNINVTLDDAPFGAGDFTATKDTVFQNLEPGKYSFTITDACGEEVNKFEETVAKDAFTIDPNIVASEIDGYDGKGNVTIHTTGAIPFTITAIDRIQDYSAGLCSNTYTVPTVVNVADYTLNDICAGEYKITVEDECGNTSEATFEVKPKPIVINSSFPEMDISGAGIGGEWSPECNPIGEINLKLTGGSGSYVLSFIEHPTNSAATPSTPVFIANVTGSYTIKDLPPGNYTVLIEDAVVSAVPDEELQFTIKSIPTTFTDIFEKYVYASVAGDKTCKTLRAKFNSSAYNQLGLFFSGGMFNVKLKVIGTEHETLSAVVNTEYMEFELPDPHTFKTMRENVDSIEIQISSVIPNCYEVMLDTLYFHDVESSVSYGNISCDGFTIYTSQYTDTRGVLCYPYTREVFDENGTLVGAPDEVDTPDQTAFATRVPFGKYKVVFTDAEGYQDEKWYNDIAYPDWQSGVGINNFQEENKTCEKYDLRFNVDNVCYPYEWQLLDEDGVPVPDNEGTVNEGETPLISSLDYNISYKVKVTSTITKESVEENIPVLDNKKALLDYTLEQYNEPCLPDTAKGYIKISRNGNTLFSENTQIELISAPDPDLISGIVYKATGLENVYYPFSSNVEVPEIVKLPEGLYEFKITDPCGFFEIFPIEYKTYKVSDFQYEIEYLCNDALLKPSAKIVLGDEEQRVYFRLIEYPVGTLSTSIESFTAGSAIPLTVSGDYKLQVSIEHSTTSCATDTTSVFDYHLEYSKVLFDKVDAYICDDGKGYIDFMVKGGVGDIEYTLIDPNEGMIKTETLPQGTPFTYTEAKRDVKYEIEFRDTKCDGAGGTEYVTVTNLIEDRSMLGPGKVCMDDLIQLYSDVPAQTYLWTFPDGTTSDLANPVIAKATLAHSGQYNLSITNIKGCFGDINKQINIEVIKTPPPVVEVTYHCISNSIETAKAEEKPEHTLLWYDENKNPLPQAPTYSRAVVNTFNYFVSQVSPDYCYSDTVPVQIIIEDFPDPVAYAYAADTCKNKPPRIIIPKEETHPDYIYRIYNSSGDLIGEDKAIAGVDLSIRTSEDMESSGFVYVEVETDHGCVSKTRLAVPVKIVHPVPPVVYDTMYCLGDADVLPLRADATDGHSLQWYDIDGVTALPSAPVPSTNVAGVFSYWVAQVDLVLGCVGDKAELKVLISDLPDIDIEASAAEICRRTSPIVMVGKTNDLYTYTLFDVNNSDTLDSKVAAGNPLRLNSPDYILHQNANLYVEVQDQYKCTSRDRAVVPVSVVVPGLPQVFDTLYCIDAVAAPLRAIPDDGYYIQWYALNESPAASAPVPPTNRVDTLYYNVTQKHNTLHCESDTVRIRVIIDALPDPVAFAYAADTCKNKPPRIIIPKEETHPDYIYRIYNSSGDLIGENKAIAGVDLSIRTSENMESSGFVYVEVKTDHGCVSKTRLEVPVKIVHPVLPVVYDTMYCLGDADVLPLRADATDGHSLQWYDIDGVTALPSAPRPSTNVAGVFSYWVAQVDLVLGCVGDKAELKVLISDLPDIDIEASADEICRRTSPVVIVGKTNDLYTYTLFDVNNSDTLDFKVADGNPLSLNSPDYILHQNADLYVEVQDQYKCTSRDRAVVPVSVVVPGLPQVFDTLYCVDAAAEPIRAIPDEGYYIQWYALDESPAASAPVPPTNRVDTLYYNVTQKHNTLHCESDTVRIRVIIDRRPDAVEASSPNICPGQHPVIDIPATKPELRYNVYSASGTFLASEQGSGDSIHIVLPHPIEESEDYFVETMNVNNCVSFSKTKTRTEVVNYMYLLPEAIPPYKRDRLYSVQLESNAVAPYRFSTENLLPMGFTLSIDGLISGTPPRNGLIDDVPFHVKVVDVNGCYADRDYVLESDLFIPQVFTPNGDGKNDVFMKGRRLVIFDRLGLKIFEGDDGWNGNRPDGTPAPPDTYFYLIYYEDDKLMTQSQKKGYITLIRRR